MTMHVRARSTVLIVGLATALALTGCSNSTTGTATPPSSSVVDSPSASAAQTSSPSSPSASNPAHKKSVVNYRQQFLADVEPWNVATGRVHGNVTLGSPSVRAAARQAIAVGRRLLSQTWPEADTADIHTLAVQFEKTASAVLAGSYAGYRRDVPVLDADANVVRGELHLAPVK